MASLKSLLNPECATYPEDNMPSAPRSTPVTALPSPRKKLKLTKDAAVFTPGSVHGECRFPPDEYQDEILAVQHERFEVTPFGRIAEYPRHIPYNSEKKNFLEKTSRECLEVFQYTFKIPGNDHVYPILWDYNIGLVRTTPLFKCTGHSKTTPSKMLNRNPGLREICHSITGGALVAQGYWIPHAAAKAIATTFCYEVRYALTPVFGHDFPDLCLKPTDDGFGDMVIDPEITRFCAQQAQEFREVDSSTAQASPSPSSWSISPNRSSSRQANTPARTVKKLKPAYLSPYHSPYTSEIDSDDGLSVTSTASPTSTPKLEILYRHVFTPINTPKSQPRSLPYPERQLPSPRDILAQAEAHHKDPLTPSSTTQWPSPQISPKTIPAELMQRVAKDRDMQWLSTKLRAEEEHAAYVLLGLKLGKSPGEAARALGVDLLDGADDKRPWSV